MYTHISKDDRVVIDNCLRHGESYASIAHRIYKDRSTVMREIRRNSHSYDAYDSRRAHVRAQKRRMDSRRNTRLIEQNTDLQEYIFSRLHPLVSPEVIAHDVGIHHQTIYSWIYRTRTDRIHCLPQRGRKRRRYGSKREKKQGWTQHVRSIDMRPHDADTREQIGHFEGDTITGKRGTRTALLTHTDRKSRFEIVHKIAYAGADVTHAAVKHDVYLSKARSITYDRGASFALWKMIERDTTAQVFFAHPYSPWERGTNENHNQRIRRIFPKGTDFTIIHTDMLAHTVWIMNHTKRKCLNWRTPCEVFGKCCTSG